MTKQAKSTAARCLHPRLQPFAKGFMKAIVTTDPVASAQRLAQMSASWPDARQRRRALAARIALLSSPVVAAVLEQDVEAIPPAAEATPEGAEPQPKTESKSPAPPKPRKPTIPAFDVKNAASMLDALNSTDDSSFSNPEYGDGRGMSMSGPDLGSLGGTDLGWQMPSDEEQKERALREMPEEGERRNRKTEEDEPLAAPPKPTMTDLSLAILTGEFSASPKPKATDNVELMNESVDLTFSEDENVQETPLTIDTTEEDREQVEHSDFVPDAPKSKKKKSSSSRKSPDLSALSALSALMASDVDETDDWAIIEAEDIHTGDKQE